MTTMFWWSIPSFASGHKSSLPQLWLTGNRELHRSSYHIHILLLRGLVFPGLQGPRMSFGSVDGGSRGDHCQARCQTCWESEEERSGRSERRSSLKIGFDGYRVGGEEDDGWAEGINHQPVPMRPVTECTSLISKQSPNS